MRSLVSTIALEIAPFHQERLVMIDNEDYSGVARKVSEDFEKRGVEVTREYLQEGILALKQYYAVALLDPKNEHAVSDQIDPFWHAHILHTRQYAAFCDRVYEQFIHHKPLDHANQEEVERVASLYRYTLTVYRRIFNYVSGQFYPTDVPECQLVCTHYEVEAKIVREMALFPSLRKAA